MCVVKSWSLRQHNATTVAVWFPVFIYFTNFWMCQYSGGISILGLSLLSSSDDELKKFNKFVQLVCTDGYHTFLLPGNCRIFAIRMFLNYNFSWPHWSRFQLMVTFHKWHFLRVCGERLTEETPDMSYKRWCCQFTFCFFYEPLLFSLYTPTKTHYINLVFRKWHGVYLKYLHVILH